MKTPFFKSSLAQAIAELVALKRLEGFDYTRQAKSLMYFDAFLHEQGYDRTSLSREIVEAYVSRTRPKAPNTRRNRLSPVCVLSRHIQQMIPDSYVLHDVGVKEPSLPRWYLYSQEDIAALLRHAWSLGSKGSLRSHTLYTLIGFLSVTGLRIAEASELSTSEMWTLFRGGRSSGKVSLAKPDTRSCLPPRFRPWRDICPRGHYGRLHRGVLPSLPMTQVTG